MCCFIVLHKCCVFHTLKICNNLACDESIGASFPAAFTHFMSLCHIFGNSHHISNFFIVIIFVMEICDQSSLKALMSTFSVQFSCSVTSDSLRTRGLQHASLLYPSPTPRACSNSCRLSRWCHPAISSSVVPFSCLQSFPKAGSFPISQFFASGSQSFLAIKYF